MVTKCMKLIRSWRALCEAAHKHKHAALIWMVSVVQHHLIRLLRATTIPKFQWNLFNGDFFSLPYCFVEWIHPVISYSCNLLFFFVLDLRISLSLFFVPLCVLCTCCVPFLPIQIECIFYVYHFICHPSIAFIYRTTFIQYMYPIVFGCVVFTLVLSVQLRRS